MLTQIIVLEKNHSRFSKYHHFSPLCPD